MKKLALIAVLVLVGFVLAVLFSGDEGESEDPGVTAPTNERANSDNLRTAEPLPDALTFEIKQTDLIRDTSREGAISDFHLRHGELGYVDFATTFWDRDPHSIVALLQQYSEYTGAGPLFDIEIKYAREREIGSGFESGPIAYSVRYQQFINGIPTEAEGTISFDESGKVRGFHGRLFDLDAAVVGDVIVQESEAGSLARDAVDQLVQSRDGPLRGADGPFRVGIDSTDKFIYALPREDEDHVRIRPEWRIYVTTVSELGFIDTVLVSVDAETGEIVRMEEGVSDHDSPVFKLYKASHHGCQTTTCPTINFRVCDGRSAQRATCDSVLTPRHKIYGQRKNGTWGCIARNLDGSINTAKCEEPQYKKPLTLAREVIDYVCSLSSEHLDDLHSTGRPIDILVNAPAGIVAAGSGKFYPTTNAIAFGATVGRPGNEWNPAMSKRMVAHETFHAIARDTGDIRHGLVSGMDAIYVNARDYSNWWYGGKNLALPQRFSGTDKHSVAGNVMYRLSSKVSRDKAIELALQVERERLASMNDFRIALTSIGGDENIRHFHSEAQHLSGGDFSPELERSIAPGGVRAVLFGVRA